jgi:5-methylcytosine-specific restriction protein B
MALEPEKITREHVEKAVNRINEEDIELIPSTGYDVVIEGKKYLPKDIMRYAHEEMNGEHVWKKGGGESTNKYLKNLGFKIEEKEQGEYIEHYLDLYEEFIKISEYDELYKWETIQNFKDNWSIDANDFEAMFDRSFQPVNCNLWVSGMYYPRKMMMEFIDHDAGTVRDMFRELYNENHDLLERVSHFKERSKDLLDEIGKGDKNHYQDDRAITVYMAFRYPEKYYLYKYTMFKDFCDMTGLEPRPKHGGSDNILKYFEVCENVK